MVSQVDRWCPSIRVGPAEPTCPLRIGTTLYGRLGLRSASFTDTESIRGRVYRVVQGVGGWHSLSTSTRCLSVMRPWFVSPLFHSICGGGNPSRETDALMAAKHAVHRHSPATILSNPNTESLRHTHKSTVSCSVNNWAPNKETSRFIAHLMFHRYPCQQKKERVPKDIWSHGHIVTSLRVCLQIFRPDIMKWIKVGIYCKL